MLKLTFDQQAEQPLHVLFLGAHSDDIEIGCGGTIFNLINRYPNIKVTSVVFSARNERAQEALTSANQFLSDVKELNVMIEDFRDGFFPYIGGEIKEYFENLIGKVTPDLIFTHYRQDLHQDHRLISDLTWNTFRNHVILEYEVPKFDGDLGTPNTFFHLDEGTCEKKVNLLLDIFKTQSHRQWFTKETFLSLLRLRGIESKAPGLYAEAFYGRKLFIM